MGRTIICPHCKSTFSEDILKQKEDENTCPVCGCSLDDGAELPSEDCPTDEELKHPDLYFYSIDSENKYEDKSLRKVWCNCVACRGNNVVHYDSFELIGRDYLRLKEGLDLTCEDCGKPFTNRIVPERPKGWLKPNVWEEDAHTPKCPTCGSADIKKISATSKAASVAMLGLLSRKVYKQWHCKNCGSEW